MHGRIGLNSFTEYTLLTAQGNDYGIAGKSRFPALSFTDINLAVH
jgi:hypothetical protein